MSENLSFPRSSLRIGRLLSARTFLLELIVAAFRPAWDVWFGCPKKDIQSYYGWKRDPDMSFFQSALLACPWIDLQLILDAKQVWYRKFGRGRHFWHALDWGDGCSDHLPSLARTGS
ncbi:hypothetical protein P8C59_009397 [Phyllachora maydis]|uniref:Uncharacterized protein n=1 Tax=Phyllachora maydis TaxID=1825666 RepID=A0AAD9MFK5_9PEZI|nr:hypothetical protein P8C59_009397 [Phyllachora maydis]